jgi:hypothetical protein
LTGTDVQNSLVYFNKGISKVSIFNGLSGIKLTIIIYQPKFKQVPFKCKLRIHQHIYHMGNFKLSLYSYGDLNPTYAVKYITRFENHKGQPNIYFKTNNSFGDVTPIARVSGNIHKYLTPILEDVLSVLKRLQFICSNFNVDLQVKSIVAFKF